MSEKKLIGIRLPLDLIAKVQAIAKDDRRSVSNLMQVIIEDYIARREKSV